MNSHFSSFRRALMFASLVFLAPVPSRAQDSPSLVGVPLPTPNGFEKLFDAVERISKADVPSPELDRLPGTEALQQKRNVVSRNKRALSALREAFQLPIQHPPVRGADEDFGNYAGFRILAGILDYESQVRSIDHDWEGAINSKLDCIELGVAMTRGGPLRAVLAGHDIEIIGHQNIEPLIARLTNAQSAAVAARLTRIESLRPPFADALREGKNAALAVTRQAFDELNWDDVVSQTLKLDGQPFSEDERATLQTIGQIEIAGGISRTFEAALSGANAAYQPQTARFDQNLDPWSTLLAGAVNSPALRVDYEAARAQNRLLAIALMLRVQRLQSGNYPENQETAPDPFAPRATLKYKRVGDSYLLYSLGPNAKDDGGKGIPIPQDGHILPGAPGDLVAPVLPL